MWPGAARALVLMLVARTASAQEAATEITVRAEHSAPVGQKAVPVELARREAGTQGDPAKVFQSLPGVGRGGIGGGELVLWGSEPRESRIELDGVPLPRLYHGSGVRSIVPAGLLNTVKLTPGAFGPEHGRAVGGLVELESRPIDLRRARLSGSADLLDAAVVASTPVSSVGAVGVGARYGYVDRWLPALMAPELRGLYHVPGYWDAQLEVAPRLAPAHELRLVALASSDRSSTELLSADPANRQHAEERETFSRIYAQYRHRDHDGIVTVTPFVGWDHSDRKLRVGQELADLNVTSFRYGLRAEHRSEVGPRLGIAFGLDAEGSLASVERLGSLSVPRREGDRYPFGTPPGARVARDQYRVHVLGTGVYATGQLSVAEGLAVRPSVRIEPTLLETSRVRPPIAQLPDQGTSRLAVAIEPRIAMEQRLSLNVRLFGAVGRYHQPPDLADLSSRFGNPYLGLASGTHVLLGESVTLATHTRVEVSVFGKWTDELAIRTDEAAARLGEVLVPTGRGRAFGSQLFVRQPETQGFSGWLSATLARSERRTRTGEWRLSDYDAPLALALTGLQRLGKWRVGARARLSSGNPRTPVVGAYYDVATQRHEPLLGPTNSARLRTFFQLDLRVDRRFELGSGSVEIYLEVLNVTARRNQEELAYSSDFRSLGSISGLPPLAMVGLTVEL